MKGWIKAYWLNVAMWVVFVGCLVAGSIVADWYDNQMVSVGTVGQPATGPPGVLYLIPLVIVAVWVLLCMGASDERGG